MDYDFSNLNDKEFEVLVNDLLSSFLNTRIERFKSGKDGGVDGRFFTNERNEIIIQTKHYAKSGYSNLLASLRKELPKVEKLNPSRYIVVTSLPLSRHNKKEIREMFSPYISVDSDIFGQEDLNDILSRNKEIEERHFKLWMSSSTVLMRLINSAIKGRSEYRIENIRRKFPKYVETNNHQNALRKLEEEHVVIIAGEPGIGKTTLAENLCLLFVAKGFDLVDIMGSFSEAESVYEMGRKQLFYCDDFLGSNYFEAIENKKDSQIVQFIERIKNDKSKRFILTSRTNILRIGQAVSSAFSNKKIDRGEFVLTIDKLSELERGKILYNHIWFSDLATDFVDEIYKDKRYRKVIRHRNFNPRIIEFITDIERIDSDAGDYWEYILKKLDDPKEIWGDCLNFQSNQYVRNLVLLTVYNGSKISEGELHRGYDKLISLENIADSTHIDKRFGSMIKFATQSFVNRHQSTPKDTATYTLFNPSIADYVLSEYCNDTDRLIKVYCSLSSAKSLKTLLDLVYDKKITQKNYSKIIESAFSKNFDYLNGYDYLIHLAYLFKGDVSKGPKILGLLQEIIKEPAPIDELLSLLELLDIYGPNLGDSSFLVTAIKPRYLDSDELQSLMGFISKHSIKNKELNDELELQLEGFLSNDVVEEAGGKLEFSEYISCLPGEDGATDIDVDYDGIKEHFKSCLDDALCDFDSDVFDQLNIDVESVLDTLDVDKMVNDYFEYQSYEDRDYREASGDSSGDSLGDIDDLFERE